MTQACRKHSSTGLRLSISSYEASIGMGEVLQLRRSIHPTIPRRLSAGVGRLQSFTRVSQPALTWLRVSARISTIAAADGTTTLRTSV